MIGNLFCPLAAPNYGWLAISTAFEEGGEDPEKRRWSKVKLQRNPPGDAHVLRFLQTPHRSLLHHTHKLLYVHSLKL